MSRGLGDVYKRQMDARSVRTELSKIRDVANVISADMAKVLDKNRQPVERRDEAR